MLLIAACLAGSPARAVVIRVPEMQAGAGVAAFAAAAPLSAPMISLTAPMTFAAPGLAAAPTAMTAFNAAPSAVAAIPTAPSLRAANAAAPAAHAAEPASASPADSRYDIVLDLDATIIGKRPEGESADGIPVEDAEAVTVQYLDWKGQPQTGRYLLRKGFKDFLRRARADANVRGIHIVSGSNQNRLNVVAQAIVVDGRPLSQWVDTLIGGEFLHEYSPQAVPDEHRRPIKDLALLGLTNLKEIDAALRRGDVSGALAMPRELEAPRERMLSERRILVVDDSPEMLRGGSSTEVHAMLAFKPAAKFVPKGADAAQRARIMAMRRMLWEHQNGEFDALIAMLDRGLIPGSPEWAQSVSNHPLLIP